MRNYSAPLLITRIITLLIAFTIHEFSHALTAALLGDPTPKRDGRLTLNPLKHLDFWGTILLLTAGYGWAKPVRVNYASVNRRHKWGSTLVSAAGPLSNFLLAVIAALVLKCNPSIGTIRFKASFLPTPLYFLSQFIWINLHLMVFNLLPVRPLDGEKVVRFFIPRKARAGWDSFQNQGKRILMVLYFLLPYLGFDFSGKFMTPIVMALYRLLLG